MDTTPPTELVLVLTTLDDNADADAFARTLVNDRLAACVNVLPEMRSVYRWKGGVEVAPERQLIIKTTLKALEALKARLLEVHPYETPEVLVVPVLDTSVGYLAWLRESVG